MSRLSDDMVAPLAAGDITPDDVATVDRVTGAVGATASAYARNTHEPPGQAIARIASSGALSARGRAALESQAPSVLDGCEVVSAEAIDDETAEFVIELPRERQTWRFSPNLNECNPTEEGDL